MNKKEFVEYCSKLNIDITEEKIKKLDIYCELLNVWNNKFNLTNILEEKDVYLKHFYDSLCIIKTNLIENKNISICDFGTGAGFPGIVIKIIYPNIKLTLIESNGKKCMFLSEVIKALKLENVEIINQRTEEYGKKNRELFDIVTCRAVSKLKIISELSIPLLKVNGYFVPLKSSVAEELEESKYILKELNSKLENIISYELPIENSKRSIIVIKKTGKTDNKYPREYKNIIK